MAKRRKRKRKFYLLYMKQDHEKVWLGEYLQKHELKSRIRKGWKVVG